MAPPPSPNAPATAPGWGAERRGSSQLDTRVRTPVGVVVVVVVSRHCMQREEHAPPNAVNHGRRKTH